MVKVKLYFNVAGLLQKFRGGKAVFLLPVQIRHDPHKEVLESELRWRLELLTT